MAQRETRLRWDVVLRDEAKSERQAAWQRENSIAEQLAFEVGSVDEARERKRLPAANHFAAYTPVSLDRLFHTRELEPANMLQIASAARCKKRQEGQSQWIDSAGRRGLRGVRDVAPIKTAIAWRYTILSAKLEKDSLNR
jgi:hypothetical protein